MMRFTTPYGEHDIADIPRDLVDAYFAAPKRETGQPDRRYKASRGVLEAIVDWSRDQREAV